uniref:Integral membrane protein 2 n=1 Tax=Osmerus mordax TaxID=8014 RepID=C1BMC4_OSMMO|nr:Integral membrane protein 2B [Osmerus mordax]
MVKVTFNSSFGQKDLKKPCADEALIPTERDLEEARPVRHQSRAWCWCMRLGLAVMLSGVVIVGAYLYKSYIMRDVFFCGVDYRAEDYMVQEDEGQEGLPSQLRHRRLTAYLDLSLNKCYVIPLNTSIVMPPKDFLELLVNIKAGTYLPQSYLVHEQMIVTERLDNMEELGFFINSLCRGRDTYRLERRETIPGIQKREALNCHKIRHFENKFVVETEICEA